MKLTLSLFIGTTFVVEDKFEYIKQIGHGAYGVVCSAYDHKSKVKVAIKKVPKAFEDLIDAKRIVREIKLLSKYNLEEIHKCWYLSTLLFYSKELPFIKLQQTMIPKISL